MMDHTTQNVDLHDIEQAIDDRFRLLRFSPAVERQFEADAGDDRCKHMIRHNYIGLMIYHCFLYGDYCAIGDAFRTDLFMHFVIMTPVMIGTNMVLARHPPAWLREGLETLALVVLTLTIVAVATASRLPARDLVQLTVILVVLFATVMQRIQFWYVVAACLAAQGLYSLGVAALVPFSMERVVMSNSVFTGILLFSLVGAYNFEHEQRMGYLLRRRDIIRNRALETMSFRDALTGIGNRHALEAAFARLPDATISGKPQSKAILLLDIDHFKQFNDTNGHLDGDICLKRVVGLVTGSLRDGAGTVYRFGGEEFLVLLDDTTLGDALIVAERIRLGVARGQIPRDASAKTFVTVSIGVACGVLGRGAAPDALIAAADLALYDAKRNGRDRISPPFTPDRTPLLVASDRRIAS